MVNMAGASQGAPAPSSPPCVFTGTFPPALTFLMAPATQDPASPYPHRPTCSRAERKATGKQSYRPNHPISRADLTPALSMALLAAKWIGTAWAPMCLDSGIRAPEASPMPRIGTHLNRLPRLLANSGEQTRTTAAPSALLAHSYRLVVPATRGEARTSAALRQSPGFWKFPGCLAACRDMNSETLARSSLLVPKQRACQEANSSYFFGITAPWSPLDPPTRLRNSLVGMLPTASAPTTATHPRPSSLRSWHASRRATTGDAPPQSTVLQTMSWPPGRVRRPRSMAIWWAGMRLSWPRSATAGIATRPFTDSSGREASARAWRKASSMRSGRGRFSLPSLVAPRPQIRPSH